MCAGRSSAHPQRAAERAARRSRARGHCPASHARAASSARRPTAKAPRRPAGVWRSSKREGERGDIVAPLAQGPQRQGKHVEAIEQVGAEAAFSATSVGRSRLAQAMMRTSTLTGCGRADRHHFAFLQRAQQLGLERRAASRRSRRAAACRRPRRGRSRRSPPMAPVKAPFCMAEQHRFEHRLGHRGAIDRDERLVRARAAAVDEAREHFLAGAGRAVDQHRNVAGGQPVGRAPAPPGFRDRRRSARPARRRRRSARRSRLRCTGRRTSARVRKALARSPAWARVRS